MANDANRAKAQLPTCQVGHVRENEQLATVRANIFPFARAAIEDWTDFPWHRDRSGHIQTRKPNSSQALAIDVFGTIKVATARDKILDALATAAGLPSGGPWQVELEWTDGDRLLREPRPTQVDVFAQSAKAIMVIECKFTEPGGSCSQTRRLRAGPGAGQPQCTGRYEPQVNPRSGIAGSCSLSAKGIRYWKVIPAVFELDPAATYAPCPFRGEAFQWMRNLVLAHELGRHRQRAAACLVVYAEGGDFPAEAQAQDHGWLLPMGPAGRAPVMISYQAIVGWAAKMDDDPRWEALARWVDEKVGAARKKAIHDDRQP